MGITFEQLAAFRAVVAHGRLGRAAASLGVSQPAVSQQMKRLEDALGFALLQSQAGKLAPTDRGMHVLRIAELVGTGIMRLEELSQAARMGALASLTIGGNTTGGMYLVPSLIRAFRRDQPDVAVRLQIGTVLDLASAVSGGVCDVAIAGGPINAKEFEVIDLFTDVLPLVASPSDPFARRHRVTLEDLRSRHFILPSVGSRTRLVAETGLRRMGVEPDSVTEYPDTESVKKAIEAGLGIGYLSREGVRRELLHRYLIEVQVEGLTIERPFQAFWLRDRKDDRLVQTFIKVAQTELNLSAARESHASRPRSGIKHD